MNQIPCQTYVLATEPPTSFTTYLPYENHPQYSAVTAPPGLFLHPRSNEWLPLCPTCARGQIRGTTRPLTCPCPEATPRDLLIPVTAVSGFFPIAYTVAEERERFSNDYEPLFASQQDIGNDARNVLLKLFRDLHRDNVDLIADKSVMYIREALRDRPHRANFQPKEALTVSHAVAMAISHHQREMSDTPYNIPCPQAISDCVMRLYEFTSPANHLVKAAVAAAPLERDAFQAKFEAFKRASKGLLPTLTQAEMLASTYYAALPSVWSGHKLIKGKHWFAQQPSQETWVFLHQGLMRITQCCDLAMAGVPSPQHFTKVLAETVQVMLIIARATCRLARVFFEHTAAEAASKSWKQRPAVGFQSLHGPDPRDPQVPPAMSSLPSFSTWHYPSSSSNANKPSSAVKAEMPSSGGSFKSGPSASLYPGVPDQASLSYPHLPSRPELLQATAPGSPSLPRQSQPTIDELPEPPAYTSPSSTPPTSVMDPRNTATVNRGSGRGHKRTASISVTPGLGLFITMALALSLPLTVATTTATTVKPPKTTTGQFNPGTTTKTPSFGPEDEQNPLLSGMFVREGFVYTHLGPRLFNPHTKTVTRLIDTSRLESIPQYLSTLALSLETLCKQAEISFRTDRDIEFNDSNRPTASLLDYFDICAKADQVPATLTNSAEAHDLWRTMKHKNMSLAMAPLRYSESKGIHFIDGTPYIAWGSQGISFQGSRHLNPNNVTREFKRLGITRPLFLYKRHEMNMGVIVVDCTKRNSRPLPLDCGAGFPAICKSVNIKFNKQGKTALKECGTTVQNLKVEAAEMTNIISSSLAYKSPNGYFQPAVLPDTYSPPTIPHGRGTSTPFLPTIPNEQAPIRHRRAVTAVVVALTFLAMAQLGTYVHNGISDARDTVHASALNKVTYQMKQNQMLDEAQDAEISRIAEFLSSFSVKMKSRLQLETFQRLAGETVNNFRILVNSAGIALNKLALAVTAQQIKRVNPSLLTAAALGTVSMTVYLRDGVTLSTNIQEVVPFIYTDQGQLYSGFLIPVIDPDRMFNLFHISPIPQFSPKGHQIVPSNVPSYVAFQANSGGYIVLPQDEALPCRESSHICHSTRPISPSHTAGCGVAPFLKEHANCTYQELRTTDDYFRTSGNFTCFSVKSEIKLKAHCLKSAHTKSRSVSTLVLRGAGCFAFGRLCNLVTDNGFTILPSSPVGVPYYLPQFVVLTYTNTAPEDLTITDQIPQDPETPGLSEMKALAMRQRDRYDELLQLDTPNPLNIFTLPAVGVCLLLIVCLSGAIYCNHRKTMGYKRIARRTMNDFEDHRAHYLNFTDRFAIFDGTSSSRPPTPVLLTHQISRPPTPTPIITEP